MTDHEFKPYADMPDLCVIELSETGETCNRPREEHDGYAISDLRIEDGEDLATLAENTTVGSISYEDWQADNNVRAGRAAVALQAYLERFDRSEPLETVVSDLLGGL